MLEILVISMSVLLVLFFSVVVVNQGTIAIITMFGKYQRIMLPGLRFKIPLVESIFRRVSIQNQSIELEFQAVTIDQANVYFKSMLLYSVQNGKKLPIYRQTEFTMDMSREDMLVKHDNVLSTASRKITPNEIVIK